MPKYTNDPNVPEYSIPGVPDLPAPPNDGGGGRVNPVTGRFESARFTNYGDDKHDNRRDDFAYHDYPPMEWRDPSDPHGANVPQPEALPPVIEPTPVIIVADIREHAAMRKQWRAHTVVLSPTNYASDITQPKLLVAKDIQRYKLTIKSRTGNTRDIVIGDSQAVQQYNGWTLTGGSGIVEFTHVDDVWVVPAFQAGDTAVLYIDILVEYTVQI